MRILHTVEFYSPSTGGMQEVVKQISENLVIMGHKVTVATSKLADRQFKMLNGVEIEQFDISGNYVNGFNGNIEKYRSFVRNGGFDIVVNFAAQQWATDALLSILPEIKAKKVFVPTGFSAFYNTSYNKYFCSLKKWMKRYDANIFLSKSYRDIDFAREIGIQKNRICIIPNGASKKEFTQTYKYNFRKEFCVSKDNILIITIGSHTGVKGHKEAIKIFKKAKITNSTLVIIGNSFGGGCTNYCRRKGIMSKYNIFEKNRIIVPNLTRHETVATLKQSDMFLFTSNIECSPIVLFESCAAKVPFLTADVGNSKEIIEWTKGGKVLPTKKDKDGYSHVDIDSSVEMLRSLVSDKKEMQKMSTNGYNAWIDKFTWEKISEKYESLYKTLLQ